MMEEMSSSSAAGISANPQDETSTTVDASGMLIGDEEEGESMVDTLNQQHLHAPSHQQQTAEDMLMVPLMMSSEDTLVASSAVDKKQGGLKARPNKQNSISFNPTPAGRRRQKRRKGRATALQQGPKFKSPRWCPGQKSIQAFMNFLARLLFWGSVVATTAAVFWYSYELKNNGTDPHLIAWFSAGAFVLLGFPISMYCIVMHLANYNQPNEQMYIVRILWMIPIYSLESWLCLRFHHLAIYIETLRDCYESYVLYSFLQFLIQVLGGEQALVNMLKDKSPTRGVHMWGLQWCVKPWLMGQPTSRVLPSDGGVSSRGQHRRMSKRIQWTSPFFVRCKFGVLQYVLLKFVISVFVMILELNGLYKEGDFGLKSGYLYICILTNLSQCWALYCLIFFYYATKHELSPINPVGKFLSVKAIVFFTWWQSVCISIFYQMGVIPEYYTESAEWTSEDVAKGLQDYLICIEMFAAALVHTFVFPHTDYMPATVAARQRTSERHSHRKIRIGRLHNKSNPYSWLYTSERDDASKNSNNLSGGYGGYDSASGDLELASHSTTSENNDSSFTVPKSPCSPLGSGSPLRAPPSTPVALTEEMEEEDEDGDFDGDETDDAYEDDQSFLDSSSDCGDGMGSTQSSLAGGERTTFVRALIDSAIPTDVIDNSVGIVKGDYVVEKKTLLHHAATSDQYDIFSTSRNYKSQPKKTDKEQR